MAEATAFCVLEGALLQRLKAATEILIVRRSGLIVLKLINTGIMLSQDKP